jgi:Ca2+-binding EF-hand superfamily protein
MAAFDMFDISRTGFMNRKDFREALKKLQVLPTDIQS